MKSTIQDNINGRRMQPFAIFNVRGTCMKNNGNENEHATCGIKTT